MWEILQEKVHKAHITDLELSMTPLTAGCRNDDMIQLGPHPCVLSRCFSSSKSTMHFCTLSFNRYYTRCSPLGFISGEFGSHS